MTDFGVFNRIELTQSLLEIGGVTSFVLFPSDVPSNIFFFDMRNVKVSVCFEGEMTSRDFS